MPKKNLDDKIFKAVFSLTRKALTLKTLIQEIMKSEIHEFRFQKILNYE